MKKIRITTILVMTVMMVFVFSSCSSKEAASDMGSSNKADYEYGYDQDYATNDEAGGEFTSGSGLSSTTELTLGNTAKLSMEKIITKADLEVETQEFDSLVNIIKDEIERLGGYDEKTEISGKRYYSKNTARRGYIIARIPRERLKEFVELVKDNGNVINESSASDNVTLQYIDTQSRKKSLEIEQERLFSLLEKTETLNDIIGLESRLSSIRYELQMYETELRTIDNKVEYSTVTITINEVERITPTVEEKETVFTRIKNGFSETIYNISEGLTNFFVWFVINLPYLIIWGIVIIGAIIIGKRIIKKNQKKADKWLEDRSRDNIIETAIKKMDTKSNEGNTKGKVENEAKNETDS